MALITPRRPSHEEVRAFIRTQEGRSLTYPAPGMTMRAEVPPGFVVDDNTIRLGQGPETFEQAGQALRRWAMFDLGWVQLIGLSDPPPISVGTEVAIVARRLGLSFVNVCRVVEVIDTTESFGFVYGTLPGHIECGEERFMVTRQAHGAVNFSIRAYSRPNHWMSKLGYIYARRSQARFAREAMRAMAELKAAP